ncbi:MAG: hypothetical protein IIC36_09755 [Gemmatimonadetes bacterium]|nr:hypothetical protein [Gemmatimonadota bacterium]
MMRLGLATVLVILTGGCAPSDDTPSASLDGSDTQGVVDVIARGLTLMAPDEIPSGWTTFRFSNESPMIHFVLVERVPDGQGIESQQAQVAPVFQDGLDLLGAGEVDAALERFGDLPAWFGEIVFLGGPGLTSPGRTSQATVYLEPGTYLLECYVKTGGIFHSYNPDPSSYGMVHEFTVTDETSEAVEPSATIQIEISTAGGIVVEGELVPGEHTVAVHFVDQTVHENFVGHDIHLVRVAGDLDLGELERWMDWTQAMGLQSPAPAEFLGGTNEMPAGTTSYFTVVLEPGNYAWVSEVPGSAEKGMLKPFSVPSGDD